MTKSLLGVVVLLCVLAGTTTGQSQPSIQGVWRPVERVIPRLDDGWRQGGSVGHVTRYVRVSERTVAANC